MEPAEHLDTLERESNRLFAAIAGNLDASVPTCPGWTGHDLVAHLGRVYTSVGLHVREHATEMIPADRVPPAPEGAAVVDFARGARDRLVADLRDADPSVPVWTWSGTKTMAFYFRRMAHETTVHRVDAELAAGVPVAPVAAESGCDGIDELIDLVIPFRLARWPHALPLAPVRLRCLETGRAWHLEADAERTGLVSATSPASSSAAGTEVVAGGGMLYLFLEERVAVDHPELEIHGDAALAQAWAELSP